MMTVKEYPRGHWERGGGPLTLPSTLLWVSPTGLGETVHCDLQPVDPKESKVTYYTSQVSKGCVAHTANTTLEIRVLFLDFPRVSAIG